MNGGPNLYGEKRACGAGMRHEVYAHREGEHAVLRCAICRSEAIVNEGHFERANDFIREHRACLDYSA